MLKIFLYLIILLATAGSFWLWRMNMLPDGIQQFMGAYGLHASGTLGCTVWLGMNFMKRRSLLLLTKIMVIVLVISSVNEISQYFDPERVVDKWDFIAQFLGIFTGGLVVHILGPINTPDFH